MRRSRSFWAVTVHTNHVGSLAEWSRAIDYIRDLGINFIRTDFTWESFEPTEGSFDWNVVDYWRSVVDLSVRKGLGFVPILDHPPTWAEMLCDPSGSGICGDTFFAHWRAFARLVATQYGSSVYYYQILNEENHPTHSFFEHMHEEEPRAFMEAYQGLLEGTGQTAASHKSRFKTVVNMWADDLPGGNDWNTYFRDILQDYWGGPSIDVVAIDHYPGTWCCGSNYRDWGAVDTLSGIARDYQKEMAIMETGFTTYGWPGHDQTDQEAYVDQAMDEVLAKKNYYNGNYPLNSLLLVSWYEFINLCSNCGGCPLVENHWGVLTYASGAWGVKLAYDNLRYQVSRWS